MSQEIFRKRIELDKRKKDELNLMIKNDGAKILQQLYRIWKGKQSMYKLLMNKKLNMREQRSR